MPKPGSRGLVIAGLIVFIPPTFTAPARARAEASRPEGARVAADPAPPGSPPGSGAPPPVATPPARPLDESRTDQLERRIKDLEARLRKLQQAQEDADVERLVMEGKVEASAPPPKTFKPKVFSGHHRAQQGLNPEISVTGDLAGIFLWSDGKEYTAAERSGFQFRGLGLHFESALDPFSYMKAAVSVSPSGIEFGEAYAVWTNVAGVMNITAGKFHQQLGVLNRWHKHALDQWDFPLMLTEPFGGALNQIGLSFDFLLGKAIAHASELTLQITNGMNAKAFSGNFFSVPTTLLHFKNYWDLSRSTYLELGLTGIVGFNHYRGMKTTAPVYTDAQQANAFGLFDANGNPVALSFAPAGPLADQDFRVTAFGGANLTICWEPVNRARYFGVTWRTEFLYGYKRLADDASGGKHAINWMGGYSYVHARLSPRVEIGVRGDLAQVFTEDNTGLLRYQVSPYVTVWQSPWVRLRFEYHYYDGKDVQGVHRFIAQMIFAAGPHKHDRY